jgi:hypothetical protein
MYIWTSPLQPIAIVLDLIFVVVGAVTAAIVSHLLAAVVIADLRAFTSSYIKFS